jgi:monofunctional biosynthetic peptidoglycan transglycosylase
MFETLARIFSFRFFLVLIGVALVTFTALWFWALPDGEDLLKQYPQVVYQGPKKPFTIKLERRKPAGWTRLDEIPKVVRGAIIVSEDWAFYQHDGIDTQQIQEVLKRDLPRGRISRGASTITQQVVKNVYLDQSKSALRKFKEILIALQLDREVSKNRILEIYFNIAEWGEGVFGIRAAASHYFSKQPSELTAKEAAFLAMLLPSPKRYSQSFRKGELTPYARRTVHSILKKMGRARFLSEPELELSLQERLSFESQENPQDSEPLDQETGPEFPN